MELARKDAGALVEVEIQRAIAKIQADVTIAKKFPRNEVDALREITEACSHPDIAEAGVYAYAKGGTEVIDASIRLAEVIARAWGNFSYGVEEVSHENEGTWMRAYAFDLERNLHAERKFHVPHIRHTKRGSYRLEDPREIYELNANMGARRLRACMLALIPSHVKKAAVDQCRLINAQQVETDDEGIAKVLEAFKKFGVTREQLEARVQRKLESAPPESFVKLREIFNSLKDGMTGPADWFDVVAPVDTAAGQQTPIDNARQRAKAIRENQQAQDKEPE
jgi:hypothetical protein